MSEKFIDIGVNLTDPVFHGIYRGKRGHDDDFNDVMKRSRETGVEKLIVTAGCEHDIHEALQMLGDYPGQPLYCTVGIHPTRCNEFEKANGGPETLLNKLIDIARDGKKSGKVVALGEMGLDYDRLQFCDVEVQKRGFAIQMKLAEQVDLPLFLHLRNAAEDFFDITKRNRHRFRDGVVHSFTGSQQELESLLEAGFYIGINGCSLKTEENVRVASMVPLNRLMLETDAPWCDIRRTHFGFKWIETQFPVKKKERFEAGCTVKSRNEPCHIVQVAEVVAGAMKEMQGSDVDLHGVCAAAYENTVKVFGL